MRIVIFSLLFLISAPLWAQKGAISGLVTNSGENNPLEYTSVAVYQSQDTTLVAGTLTDENGLFKFEDIKPGSYFLRIQYLGYQRKQTDNFTLKNQQRIELGGITLYPATQNIDEVNITANRISVMNKLDKQTYDAGQFGAAKGGSAIDVLKNMPSVAVNGMGEITMRGSSGFLVLINGKPVLTDPQTALSRLPANSIGNVELITSPSAKYDPDGKSGIINITTKEGTANETGFLVNASYGLPGTTDFGNSRDAKRFGADASYHFQKDKWNVSLSGNYTRNDLAGYREGDVYTQNTTENTLTRFPSEGERSFERYNYAVRASVDFQANKQNAFSVGLFTGKRYQERDANIFYHNTTWTLDTNEKINESPYYNANKQIKQGTFTLGDFNYTHTFNNHSTLTTAFLYEYDDLFGTTHNRNLTEPGGQMIQYVQNPYQKPIDGYRVKLDYAIDIGKGKLESGYQYRNDSQDGKFDYSVSPLASDPLNADQFRGTALSKNQTHSLYGQYSGSSERLEYIVGLRFEDSRRTVELSFDPQKHVLELSNLFPSANILYALQPELKLKAGFSRRIQRSTNNQLNPIPEREHSETLEVGDPDLRPELINLAEIGLTKQFKEGSSLFVTAYFQASKDPVQRVNSVYADSILNRVYTNVDNARTTGIELGANLHPAKWWNLYFGGNFYHQTYEGDLRLLNEPVIKIDHSGSAYSLNANSTFKLTSSWNLEANVNYLSSRPTAQGEDSRYLIPNLSLRKTFFDNQLTATVQWQNIDLGMNESNRQRITTWGDDFRTTTNYIYETDFVMVNLSYKLNWKNGRNRLPSSEFGEKEF